jgi:hypothetical protein
MKKAGVISFFLLTVLFFQKGYSRTITHLYLSAARCIDCTNGFHTKEEHSYKQAVYYNGNSCCIEYGVGIGWDSINKLMVQLGPNIVYFAVDNPHDCLYKLTSIAHLKKLRILYFNGDDVDYAFDSIPAEILLLKSLRQIKLRRIDHSEKIKNQVKRWRKDIWVRIPQRHYRRMKEADLSYFQKQHPIRREDFLT